MNFNVRQKALINATDKNILCLACAAAGKAIPIETKIPTPRGMKQAGKIKVGDLLFDREGRPTTVIGVYPQNKPKTTYELTFGDGRKAKCCIDHLWNVNEKATGEYVTRSVRELLSNPIMDEAGNPIYYIQIASAVEYSQKPYLIDPYRAGSTLGYLSKEYDEKYMDNQSFSIDEPCILESYRTSSIEQRVSLLQGIADEIGAATEESQYFTSKSIDFLKDIAEVLWSIGCKNTIEDEDRNGNYRLVVMGDKNLKYSIFKNKISSFDSVIFNDVEDCFITPIVRIENLGYKTEMVCFEVDNSEHLFLMNDYIVTHNTRTLVGRIDKLLDSGVKPNNIVAFTFTNQAADEMKQRLGSKSDGMFIGTLHSYANKICNMAKINTSTYIESEKFDEIIRKALGVPAYKYPTVEHLFVDEFQDTDSLQYQFICKIPAMNRFYVGDERQFIYSFRGASDIFIRELATNNKFKKYSLVENYRNPPNILRFADNFLKSMQKISPSSVSVLTENGYLEKCSFYDAAEEMTWTTEWTNWAILCRANTEIEAAKEYLDSIDVPNVVVKRGDLDIDQQGILLKQNRVKIMTIHASKGLEFDNVIAIGCKDFQEEERRICYVAATRAKKALYWCPTIKKYRGKAKGTVHLAGNFAKKTAKKTVKF